MIYSKSTFDINFIFKNYSVVKEKKKYECDDRVGKCTPCSRFEVERTFRETNPNRNARESFEWTAFAQREINERRRTISGR